MSSPTIDPLEIMRYMNIGIGIYKTILTLVLNNRHQSQDGRVGLRRPLQVRVRKGVGSNPTLDKQYYPFFHLLL